MMKSIWPWVGTAFLCTACASGGAFSRDISSNEVSPAARCRNLSQLQVHGHRGAWDRPENMIPAFKRGIELGADFVELDLQITRDDRVVVAHDVFLRDNCIDPYGKALNGRKIYFRDLSLREVKQYDCGSQVSQGKPAPGERVPTLEEVFSAMQNEVTHAGRPAKINVELKYNPTQPQYFPSREDYVSLVIDVLNRSRFDSSRLIFQSFDADILRVLKRRRPDLEVSPIFGDSGSVSRGVQTAQSMNAKWVGPTLVYLTPASLRAFHQAGIKVLVWTVDDPQGAAQAIDWGVDGITTNHPELLDFARGFCR